MHRSFPILVLVGAVSPILFACGSTVVERVSGSEDSGSTSSSTSGGGAGATAGSSTANATAGSGGSTISMCPAPPPPAPGPGDDGCYQQQAGGYVKVPCLCELWATNTKPGPITATIGLSLTQTNQMPGLSTGLDVEIDFDDPNGTWLAAFTAQAGNGTAFNVTDKNPKTTVRMGQSMVTLGPVPLDACEKRTGFAEIDYGPTLEMHVVYSDGTAASDSACLFPHP